MTRTFLFIIMAHAYSLTQINIYVLVQLHVKQTCVLKVNIQCDGCKHKVKKVVYCYIFAEQFHYLIPSYTKMYKYFHLKNRQHLAKRKTESTHRKKRNTTHKSVKILTAKPMSRHLSCQCRPKKKVWSPFIKRDLHTF